MHVDAMKGTHVMSLPIVMSPLMSLAKPLLIVMAQWDILSKVVIHCDVIMSHRK